MLIGSSAGAAHLSKDNAGVRCDSSTWAETSRGPERDKLPLFESSARLTTVNAGPIDPLVTILFCLWATIDASTRGTLPLFVPFKHFADSPWM